MSSHSRQASHEPAAEYSFNAPAHASEYASVWRDDGTDFQYGVVDLDSQFGTADTADQKFAQDGTVIAHTGAVVVPFPVIINQATTREQAERALVAFADEHENVSEDQLKVVITRDPRSV